MRRAEFITRFIYKGHEFKWHLVNEPNKTKQWILSCNVGREVFKSRKRPKREETREFIDRKWLGTLDILSSATVHCNFLPDEENVHLGPDGQSIESVKNLANGTWHPVNDGGPVFTAPQNKI